MAFVKHPDTIAIEARLRQLSVGETITWEELAAAIGCDCSPGSEGYSRLASARNSLLNDRIVIGCIIGVGLKYLSDSDIAEVSGKEVKKVRRASRKSLKKLASVREFDELSPDQKRQHLVASAQLGAVHEFSKPAAQKKIAAAVNGSPLSLGRTLSLFNGQPDRKAK